MGNAGPENHPSQWPCNMLYNISDERKQHTTPQNLPDIPRYAIKMQQNRKKNLAAFCRTGKLAYLCTRFRKQAAQQGQRETDGE